MTKVVLKPKTAKAIAKPVGVLPVPPQVKPVMHIVVDLTGLIRHGHLGDIHIREEADKTITTWINLNNNEIMVVGRGPNALAALADLNQKVIDKNFEL